MYLRCYLGDQNRTFSVFEGEVPVGEIHLDELRQVSSVILFACGKSEQSRLRVLWLAVSYMRQLHHKYSTVLADGRAVVSMRSVRALSLTDMLDYMSFESVQSSVRRMSYKATVDELSASGVFLVGTDTATCSKKTSIAG